jgi:hypothetical protein
MTPIVTDKILSRLVVGAIFIALVLVAVAHVVGAVHPDFGRALGRAPAIEATWGVRRI